MQLQDILPLKKFWNFESTPTLLRNVANLIYLGKIANQDVVLRLTPASQREASEVPRCEDHIQKFFIKNGEIVLFDFDDSCYHYFLYDLTVPIMAIFKKIPRPKNFKADFIKFVQFRCILIYMWLRVIRREREFSEAMIKNIEMAIKGDLRLEP